MSSEDKTPRLTVYFPESVKCQLQQMAKETGFSQTQLVVLATHALLANYRNNGNAIFAELLNVKSNSRSES
ncbi:hypothetical protein NDK47_11070 [Brevibacillus ruminantium]|uniref:CopG family transcriptional regulator n=1 Tax=Brevibacillus ruminantium TaxID=2950604 RepID=A0ABY4WKU5_9BACL|nr:hypothetical protein [Brevibacillus ruminantium]USG67775.1 hypothetical protein NDK47_11070 [Brevibacillus ruminantium]